MGFLSTFVRSSAVLLLVSPVGYKKVAVVYIVYDYGPSPLDAHASFFCSSVQRGGMYVVALKCHGMDPFLSLFPLSLQLSNYSENRLHGGRDTSSSFTARMESMPRS